MPLTDGLADGLADGYNNERHILATWNKKKERQFLRISFSKSSKYLLLLLAKLKVWLMVLLKVLSWDSNLVYSFQKAEWKEDRTDLNLVPVKMVHC